jgi:hypothetical protein
MFYLQLSCLRLCISLRLLGRPLFTSFLPFLLRRIQVLFRLGGRVILLLS